MNQVANRFANQPNEWIWMQSFQTTFHQRKLKWRTESQSRMPSFQAWSLIRQILKFVGYATQVKRQTAVKNYLIQKILREEDWRHYFYLVSNQRGSNQHLCVWQTTCGKVNHLLMMCWLTGGNAESTKWISNFFRNGVAEKLNISKKEGFGSKSVCFFGQIIFWVTFYTHKFV